MNAKSILFIFALLALFNLATANVANQKSKRDLEDDELLSDALSLMQKLLKTKETKEKQRIAQSLETKYEEDDEDDVKDEIEIEDNDEEADDEEEKPELNLDVDEKYVVGDVDVDVDGDEEQQENDDDDVEEVEVITVTVEVDEDGNTQYSIDTSDKEGDEAEDDVVEGEDDESVEAGVINKPGLNLEIAKNAVDAELEVEGDDGNIGTVDYDVNDDDESKENKEETTYYYEVKEGDYEVDDDTYNAVVEAVGTEDKEETSNTTGVIGASVAVLGAFGVLGAAGYKYTQRKKRVLLPFHEDILEKGEFYDKENPEQHIIPVWAAAKKEENEEEKEEEEKLFEVVYNYEPELPDELKLTVGDKIKIKEIYEDGWAYGYNKTTQLFGTFPSTSLGENFNPESVPQYKPEEVAVEMNDNMVEELKKKIVENN